MGSPAGEKNRSRFESQVSVRVTKPFELGKYEVTQGQWKSVMGTEPWTKYKDTIQGENVAAAFVNYGEAVDFCERLTDLEHKSGKLKANEEYRLPTEAEWEYACRAGTETAFSFGDDEKQLGDYAWFNDNALDAGEVYAHAVGLKKPNPWGLHDMHGNVFEWCSNWYSEKLSGGADPVGPTLGVHRVFRGGSWGQDPLFSRSANRGIAYNGPSHSHHGLGFRVARSQSVQ